jgi:formylglycine-generating enzyme required for sulfatase activity|tara:strand:+ start:3739 stop:5799 length:2061 start_codon:yes stop_codon:yes gene_type:complete
MNAKRTPIKATQFAPSSKQSFAQGPFSKIRPWQIVAVVAAIFSILSLGFLFTSKSVQLNISPTPTSVNIGGGIALNLGDVYLLREGTYTVTAQTPLHEKLNRDFNVGNAKNQRKNFTFTPLPGLLKLQLKPRQAMVKIDGVVIAKPNELIELSSGEHIVEVSAPRYLSHQQSIEVVGKKQEQNLSINLSPGWADILLTSEPAGANIWLDDQNTGLITPSTVQALAGERGIRIQKTGYRAVSQRLFAQAGQPQTLDLFQLIQADAQVTLTSNPTGAAAILNGEFLGQTPLQIDLKSNSTQRIGLIYAGHARADKTLRMDEGEVRKLHVNLEPLKGIVAIETQPLNTLVSINGRIIGNGKQSIQLPLEAQTITLSLDGYAGFETIINPKAGITQSLKVKLLTLEEARIAALKPIHTTSQAQRLRLFSADSVDLGASRREPGRRANETMRTATFTRLFYVSEHEVTNEQFRAFATGHDSGSYQETNLNDNDQPVVKVSWHEAAAYCNWLSKEDGLEPFYQMEFSKVVGQNSAVKGYRLPTEAEWAWSARKLPIEQQADGKQLRFAWGNALPPPERFENYADRSAANIVGRIIFAYNDNYRGSAPVGTFKANHHQLFDMGGNVAEWTHDFYAIPKQDAVEDYLGPVNGEYHVIKGASWMHGTITELRLSFRDYAVEGRQDVGFRIARYAE